MESDAGKDGSRKRGRPKKEMIHCVTQTNQVLPR